MTQLQPRRTNAEELGSERPDGSNFEDENFHFHYLVSCRLAERTCFGKLKFRRDGENIVDF
jgi:hypothetical protein